jgi:hypothetical protein
LFIILQEVISCRKISWEGSMEIKSRSKRGDIAGGLILVLIGIVFLIWQLAPDLISNTLGINFTWPLLIVGIGLIFLLAGIITLQGGFLVPAAILSGIGGILYYQNTTGDWASWAYIWALIPGFVGFGLLLGSFIDRSMKDARKVGFIMLLISLGVTAMFGAFFTNNIEFDYAWPIILILAGIVFLFQGIFRRR